MAPNQAMTITKPYRATRAATPVVRLCPDPAAVTPAASSCDIRSPFCVHLDAATAPHLPPKTSSRLQVSRSDQRHYLRSRGDLSSSAEAIHPGEIVKGGRGLAPGRARCCGRQRRACGTANADG